MSKNSRNTLIRIVLVSLYAIAVMRLVSLGMPKDAELQLQIPKGLFLFFYLLFFNLNVEGSLFFDCYLNKKHPWYSNPQKRLFYSNRSYHIMDIYIHRDTIYCLVFY